MDRICWPIYARLKGISTLTPRSFPGNARRAGYGAGKPEKPIGPVLVLGHGRGEGSICCHAQSVSQTKAVP